MSEIIKWGFFPYNMARFVCLLLLVLLHGDLSAWELRVTNASDIPIRVREYRGERWYIPPFTTGIYSVSNDQTLVELQFAYLDESEGAYKHVQWGNVPSGTIWYGDQQMNDTMGISVSVHRNKFYTSPPSFDRDVATYVVHRPSAATAWNYAASAYAFAAGFFMVIVWGAWRKLVRVFREAE